jgi:predicted heme/steroid binding protein
MPYSWLIWTTIGIVGSSVAVQWQKDRINLFLMGVFRDIGRHKAYKRRFADQSVALMTLLLHQEEDPLLGSISLDEEDKNSNVPTYTLDELWEYGNGNDDSPLLISIFGRIYDVSAGEKFYGPRGSYPQFPGRDVTFALSTGCRSCASDPTKTAEDLTDAQLQEGKRWLSFFQLHDKYPYVGKLDRHPMEAQMNQWIDDAMANKDESDMERHMVPPIPILN